MQPKPLSPISILKAYDQAELLTPEAFLTLDNFAQGEQLGREVTQLRLLRGERQVGYKIGFTNRSIWPLYGVSRPVWAPMYASTVTQLPGTQIDMGLGRFVQPRLEPEIVLGLRSTPTDDSLQALADALEWVAHGFEIVQSPFPNWKFTASQAQAAQGLHGALLIGPRYLVPDNLRTVKLAEALSKVSLTLAKASPDDTSFSLVATGAGSAVLDGPLQALGFLVRGLTEQGLTLRPGDIVTTGTLTDAMPLQLGDRWRTELATSQSSSGELAQTAATRLGGIELALSGLTLTCLA